MKSLKQYLREHPKIVLWGIVVMTAISLLLTLIPGEAFSNSFIWSYDKLGHLLLFGGWTYLLGLYSTLKHPARTKLWKIFLLGLIFGGSIEILQEILPVNRTGDIVDFLVDALGAILAIAMLKLIPFSEEE